MLMPMSIKPHATKPVGYIENYTKEFYITYNLCLLMVTETLPTIKYIQTIMANLDIPSCSFAIKNRNQWKYKQWFSVWLVLTLSNSSHTPHAHCSCLFVPSLYGLFPSRSLTWQPDYKIHQETTNESKCKSRICPFSNWAIQNWPKPIRTSKLLLLSLDQFW